MGISDDIVRKKSHKTMLEPTPVIKHEVFDDDKSDQIPLKFDKGKPADEPDKERKGHPKSRKEELSDSFFSQKKKDEAEEEDDKNDIPTGSKRKIAGFLFVFLFILLGVILTYQNYSEIKAMVTGKSDAKPSISAAVAPTSSDSSSSVTQGTATAPSTTATQPATTPTATTGAAVSTVNKASLKIQVLNGNGITGSAQTVKSTLETAGFTVSSLTNAKKFTYATTIVYYKTGKSDGADLVKAALSSRQVATQNSDSAVGIYDIIVIVGKQ